VYIRTIFVYLKKIGINKNDLFFNVMVYEFIVSFLSRVVFRVGYRNSVPMLRAMYVPGVLNRMADELSRAVLPGEW